MYKYTYIHETTKTISCVIIDFLNADCYWGESRRESYLNLDALIQQILNECLALTLLVTEDIQQ